jgi:hypothetical protein
MIPLITSSARSMAQCARYCISSGDRGNKTTTSSTDSIGNFIISNSLHTIIDNDRKNSPTTTIVATSAPPYT